MRTGVRGLGSGIGTPGSGTESAAASITARERSEPSECGVQTPPCQPRGARVPLRDGEERPR